MNTPGSLPVRRVACVHRKLRLIRAHNRFMVRRRSIEEELSFTYHGMAVNDGTMDMTDFGNALIGYAQAIRATVTELDPNAHTPDIRITRTEKGSFTVYAKITQDISVLTDLFGLLQTDNAQALATGAEIVAGAGTVGAALLGAVKLGKHIAGRTIVKRDSKRDNPDVEQLTLSDGETIEARRPVVNITNNYNFNAGIRAVIQPTLNDGVDGVQLKAGDQTEQLREAHLSAFPTEESTNDITTTETTEAILAVERIAFDGGPWRFTRLDTDQAVPYAFQAEMVDEEFRHKVEESKIAFRNGDRIKAQLEITDRKPGKGRHTRSWRIIQVNQIIPYTPPSTLPGI